MKILYTLQLARTEKVETKTDNGDGSFTTKLTDHSIPVQVYLKLPSRRDREEISLVYNAQYGMALGKGLQPADVIKRSLLDSGGIVARQDLEVADDILKQYNQKRNEIIAAQLEKLPTDELEKERLELAAQFERLEQPQREIYSRTAEFYAESKTVEWCVLNLSYYSQDKDYLPVFPGPTHDSRLTTYYEWCDEDDNAHAVEKDAYNNATLVYYHHLLGGHTSQEHFDQLLDVESTKEKEKENQD